MRRAMYAICAVVTSLLCAALIVGGAYFQMIYVMVASLFCPYFIVQFSARAMGWHENR